MLCYESDVIGNAARLFTTRSVSFEPPVIPGRHRSRFIDSESPALEVPAVHIGNSLISAVLQFHETKTLGAACIAISDDTNRFNRTCLAEQFLEFSFCRFGRQVSDIQLLFHGITSL